MEKKNNANAISVYQTDKRLIELRDKLNSATPENYAKLHGGEENGKKIYSNIGVVLLDYSNGTGSNTVKVYVNVSPEDIFWLNCALSQGRQEFLMEQQKIFGLPDENGYSKCTKLRIVREGVDKSGAVRRYPWCISAENGLGIAAKTAIGGTFCKGGTYKCTSKAYIMVSDEDLFRLVNRAARYIELFERTYCPSVIEAGRALNNSNQNF